MHSQSTGKAPGSSRALWKRGLLGAVATVAFFCALEAVLRLLGYGAPSTLFIPDERTGYVRTNPRFTESFLPPQFDITPLSFRLSRHKEPGHIRVFVLGESAVRGIPEPGLSFVPLVRAHLQQAFPGRQIEVYNLGIVAINSHVVRQMAEEAADLEPDLMVVYMGNNEVVGPFGPGSATRSGMPPLSLIRASMWTSRTRTGQLVSRLLGWISGESNHAIQWRGMGTFTDSTVRGNDPRLDGVYSNFRANLTDIVRIARRHSIKAVVSTLVCNLEDNPPFASLHRAGLSAAQLERWTTAYGIGLRHWELRHGAQAIGPLREAIEIDPEYAEAHYLLGQALAMAGEPQGSRVQYLESVHWDALRFRPDPQINSIIREVAAGEPGTVVLEDAALELGSDPLSKGPPTGRELLWEHVHFNWEGSKRVARLLARGSSEALLGDAKPAGRLLDDAGCAAAVGYSPLCQVRMLREMNSIVAKPPFTRQLTFGEDQVRYAHDLGIAASEAGKEGQQEESRDRLVSAMRRDPDNADLALRLSELEFESGHPERALGSIDHALEIEPPSPDLLVRRSRTLAALNRIEEAQSAVVEAIRLGPHHFMAYTELVEVLRRTGDFRTGQEILGHALAANPSSDYLRLTHADLLFYHGDQKEALRECQAVLAANPQSAEALGRLVSFFTREGRKDEAMSLMLRAREEQPLNFANDMALAREYERRNDEAKVAECLGLAELCGPAEPEVHVFLARRLVHLNRNDEALVEFARARRVALLEGKAEMADAVSRMMEPLSDGAVHR